MPTLIPTLSLLLSLTPLISTAPTPRATKLKFGGVNLSGYDFGCMIDGNCYLTGSNIPHDIVNTDNALGQLNHFVKDDGLNAFRLPVGWQFLTNDQLGGKLDSNNFGQYDRLVQGCLSSEAQLCIVDIHNYARWNGGIIGQGGPTNAQFVDIWTQLANKYGKYSKIAFGIMNEPHDVPDIKKWAATVQEVVTAIRKTGATNNLILLPGNNWTSAEAFVSSGSAEALAAVTNPDNTTTNLIMDVHKYLDSDNSGTHTECVKDNIENAFKPLAEWLRANKRQAMLTETGGGNTASCEKFLCQELRYLSENSDVYLGYTTWAAGGFASSYELYEVPTQNGDKWTDTSLVTSCVVGVWKGS